MLNFKIDDAAKYLALVSAALYASGFLIVNSNLARYGDFDPDFASSRYIFAGFLFVWYLIPVTWLVLKYMYGVYLTSDDLSALEKLSKPLYIFASLQILLIDSIARICVASIFFGEGTLENVSSYDPSNAGVIVLFGISFLIAKFWRFRNLFAYLVLMTTVQGFAIYVFSRQSDTELIIVATSYFLILALFTYVIGPLISRRVDFESISTVIYFLLSSIGLIIAFGAEIYGHVKHQYGGGLPVSVTLYMKSDVGTSELTRNASGGFLVDMIALNDKKLIGVSGGKPIVINAEGIASIVYP